MIPADEIYVGDGGQRYVITPAGRWVWIAELRGEIVERMHQCQRAWFCSEWASKLRNLVTGEQHWLATEAA